MDNGPHACDLIRRFLGEVVLAKGFVRQDVHLPAGCETEAYALFRNHDNAVAELHASWALRTGYLTVEIRGSEGHLKIETAPWRLTGSLADGRQIDRRYLAERIADRVHRVRYGCERSIVRELEAFASPSGSHPRLGATGWDGCRVTEMIQAVYQSDRTGDEIHLKPLLVHLPTQRPTSGPPRPGASPMTTGGLPILTYHAIDASGAVTSTEPSSVRRDPRRPPRARASARSIWASGSRPAGLTWIEASRWRSTMACGRSSASPTAWRGWQVPATVFLVADRIGLDNAWPGQPSAIPRARLLDRSDLESLARLGFRFGSHGRSHLRFDRLTHDELKDELIRSRDQIEQMMGCPCPLLAYPYGAANVRVRTEASRVYDAAFGTRLGYASPADDLFDIARIDAYYLRPRGRWNC